MRKEDQLLQEYKSVQSDFQSYHSYMQTLHDFFFVSSENVTRAYSHGAELDFTDLWDATSINAVKVAVAGVHSYLTPPSSKWFDLSVDARDLEDNYEVRKWLNDAADEVYYVLSRSNFDQQADTFYAHSFVYGTSIMYSEEDFEDEVRYKTVPIKNVFVVEDAKERIARFYIKHDYTALQAMSEFGQENLPRAIVEEYQQNPASKKTFEFCHFVGKREVFDQTKKDSKNMPWESRWIEVKSSKTVKESGYWENPFGAHRFYKRAGHVTGFSPCMDSLPFVRTLNTIVETNLVGAQTVIRPPLDVPDQGYITQFNLNPGALNIRRSSLTKEQMVKPLITGANPQIGVEFQEMYKRDIRESLFNDIFLAFSDITKQMSVPEVRERIAEKMSMLGPAVGRFQTEFLENVIHRTLAILMRNNRLPPVPDALRENPNYKIELVSPLALAQRTNDLAAINDLIALAGSMAEAFPSVLDKIDSDMVIDVVSQARGTPMEILNSDERVEEIRQARQKVQQAQETIQMAQEGAKAYKEAASGDKEVSVSQKVSAGQ